MCVKCGKKTQIDIVLTDANGSRAYCPNHIIEACLAGKLRFVPNNKFVDDVKHQKGAVKFYSPYSGEVYFLAPATMRRLINHSLYKAEFKGIVRTLHSRGFKGGYGQLPYELHDDFYAPDGFAYQPAVPNPQLTKIYE